jgi:ubiquinone/menaquinone biosynthesis C-methylase UbiE
MSEVVNDIDNKFSAEAFSKQSGVFDSLYSNDTIIRYKRERVRETVLSLLKTDARILELNCGTGEDAVFFASKGYAVHATDVAEGMVQKTNEKIANHSLQHKITTELCSYTALENLKDKGPYDIIFSNFGGLNCTGELHKALDSFHALLKPGGAFVIVVIPPFCLWETLLVFKGQFKTALRRFFSNSGRSAHIEGVHFTCWYYSPKFIINRLKKNFELLKLEGLCTIVPPSYMEGFAEKHPRLYDFLVRKERKLNSKRPWRSIGDYFILSMRKTG